jgi:hypothetical protein
MILSFSDSRKVEVTSKWFSHVTFDYDLFMEGLKKKIWVYKDLKFMLLRLIYDY